MIALARSNECNPAEGNAGYSSGGYGGYDNESPCNSPMKNTLVLGDNHHTVTISENVADGILEFAFKEVGKQDAQPVNVQCPVEQFDNLCLEEPLLTGGAQIEAVLQRLIPPIVVPPPQVFFTDDWVDY